MKVDLTGMKFGRLTVIERDGKAADNYVRYKCRCECGKKSATHGMSKTKIYKTWCDMRDRCYNPKKERYPNYGGRGIKVCDEWRHDFKAFYDFVSKLEHFGEDGYTLDRINVDGDYEPGNVRWATNLEQARNKTNNHAIEIGGKQMILADVARLAGVTNETIYKRLKLGATEEELLSKERITAERFDVGDGRFLTLREITKETGICKETLRGRIRRGWNGAELLKPSQNTNH